MASCANCGPLAPHDVTIQHTADNSTVETSRVCGYCAGPVRGF